MSIRTSLVCALAVLTTVAGVTGCRGTTEAGTAYTFKINRELRGYLPTDLFNAHRTARQVLEHDFLFEIELDVNDAREGVVQARTATNHFVKVHTLREGEQSTRIDIFVSPLGDEKAEAEIFDLIERRIRGAA